MLRRILLLTLLIPAVGCILTKTVPFDATKSKVDAKLHGRWTLMVSEKEEPFIEQINIEKLNAKEKQLYPLGFMKLTIEKSKEKGFRNDVFYFCTGNLGDEKLAALWVGEWSSDEKSSEKISKLTAEELKSARAKLSKFFSSDEEALKQDQGFVLFKYSIEKDQLNVEGLGKTAERHSAGLASAFKKIKADGKKKLIGVDGDEVLTDTSASVRKYLLKHGQALFPAKSTFKRVKSVKEQR